MQMQNVVYASLFNAVAATMKNFYQGEFFILSEFIVLAVCWK